MSDIIKRIQELKNIIETELNWLNSLECECDSYNGYTCQIHTHIKSFEQAKELIESLDPKELTENEVNEKTKKIMNAIKINFEGSGFDQIITESECDEELKDLESFYSAIRYDLQKILRNKM